MKKIVLLACIIFLISGKVIASEPDYRSIYMNLEMPKFSYVHGIDPKQFYDNQYATYSVYPLFRLCTPLYFKSVKIMPGYYDLTPREYKGEYYLLFKQNGMVRHIVPIYKRELVPSGFYKSHLPKEKYTWTQKVGNAFYMFVGKHIKSAKRKPTAKTYLEVNDMNDNFVIMIIYYNNFRYYTIFRTVQI